MATIIRDGSLPHIKWIDLHDSGIVSECAVMKQDAFGNIYFFEVASLDKVDKGRLVRILHNRNAKNFDLWDLLSQNTLGNGMNALEYFHQLVKVITPSGEMMGTKYGKIGYGRPGVVNTNKSE